MILSGALVERLMSTIWLAAVFLTLVGLVVMLVLIGRRVLQEKLDARRLPLRREARAGLMAWLEQGFIPPKGLKAMMQLPQGDLALTIDETSQLVKGGARQRLADLGREVGVDAHLRRQLRARRAAWRIEAARRLALFADEQTRAALLGHLNDRVPAVRLAIVEALLRSGANVEGVVERVWTDPALSDRGASRLFVTLAQSCPEQLASRLDPFDGSLRQLMSIQALAEAGAIGSGARIKAMMQAPRVIVREVALLALARLNHRDLPRIIEAALDDKAPRVRRIAVRLARARTGKIALESLAKLVNDTDPSIRRAIRQMVPKEMLRPSRRARGRMEADCA